MPARRSEEVDLAEVGIFQEEYNEARKEKRAEGACKGEIIMLNYRC